MRGGAAEWHHATPRKYFMDGPAHYTYDRHATTTSFLKTMDHTCSF